MITRVRIDAEGTTWADVDEQIAHLEGVLIQSGQISQAALSNAHIVEEVVERVCRGNNVGDTFKGRRTTSYKAPE